MYINPRSKWFTFRRLYHIVYLPDCINWRKWSCINYVLSRHYWWPHCWYWDLSSSAQKSSTTNDSSASDITVFSDTTNQTNEIVNGNPISIPSDQSVYETGTMSLPTSVKSFIIFIPDEAHHVPEDQKTISPKNPNYLPSTLQIPDGTEVAFVHGDPQHVHVEIVKDNGGNLVWTTTPVKHPGGSDTKILTQMGHLMLCQISSIQAWKINWHSYGGRIFLSNKRSG